MKLPRTLIFTGDGKGKTTAAFGMVMRAIGHGQRVLIVQFLKSNANSGELKVLTLLPGVEWVQMGRGFVPHPDHADYPAHREMAVAALEFAREHIAAGTHNLIVLDEICGAVARGLIEEDAVLTALADPGRVANIVLTGRSAMPGLIGAADTVTEMQVVKHGYASGIPAQKGVEF
jgi:cob(I)alamin adenosyltransferase